MSSSPDRSNVTLTSGDVLNSRAQTLVNTVNCVGVMGKGIALAFKRCYPEMFEDYVARCDRKEVQLGRPYIFRGETDHWIMNFPTKDHWRAVSRLQDIIDGLNYLQKHYKDWGITSLAMPPLGCGNGQLEWKVVGPTLIRHLAKLDIPVELFVPQGESVDAEQLALVPLQDDQTAERFVPPEWVAIVAILDHIEHRQRQQYHWPVGRIMFQKLVYFATQAGIPTGLRFEAASYGPFAPSLKRHIASLQNNGLAAECQRGNMFQVTVGSTYGDAVSNYRETMEQWRPAVERTADLMSRMNTSTAEVAATVHFTAMRLLQERNSRPTASEVIAAVEEWKVRRNPPVKRAAIVDALAVLGMQGWLDVELDEAAEQLIDDLIGA
jgi:uncharacterized protein YwgA/O-acetyl-ADP-ribose deacetylase (regulator of RNase III)